MNRGIEKSKIPHYLNTSDDDILHFGDIKNIEEGAKLLISHIAQNHKIMV